MTPYLKFTANLGMTFFLWLFLMPEVWKADLFEGWERILVAVVLGAMSAKYPIGALIMLVQGDNHSHMASCTVCGKDLSPK